MYFVMPRKNAGSVPAHRFTHWSALPAVGLKRGSRQMNLVPASWASSMPRDQVRLVSTRLVLARMTTAASGHSHMVFWANMPIHGAKAMIWPLPWPMS